MMLFTGKLDNSGSLFHIGVSLDHKFFAEKKKWTLGMMINFTVIQEGKEPLQAEFIVGLWDCSNPRTGDTGAETTAKRLVEKMKTLGLWEYRDNPEINLAVDGGLHSKIVPFLEAMGWTEVIYCIVLCEGHTIANIYKLIYNYVFQVVLKNQHWEGRVFQYV